jgi:hypothetical protein
VKRLVREQAIATTTSLRREGDFAVPHLWYDKVQAGLTPASDVQKRRKRRLPSHPGLRSFIYCLNEIHAWGLTKYRWPVSEMSRDA